jgi:acyl-CoA synthetase (AMP-forming)/AMP-acid ligase II
MIYSRIIFLSIRKSFVHLKSSFRLSSTSRPIYYESVSQHANNVAFIDHSSSYTYGQLYFLSRQLSRRLIPLSQQQKSTDDISNKRSVQIGVLCPNDVSFIIAMWASWMVGATVVPLSSHHPPASLAYFLSDAQCRGVIVGDDRSNELIKTTLTNNSQVDIPIININKKNLSTTVSNEDVSDDLLLSTTTIDRTERSNALIIYTSGTSGKPKGCVLTFDTVQAHVDSMIKAWRWTKDDGNNLFIKKVIFILIFSYITCFIASSCSWSYKCTFNSTFYWCDNYYASSF